LRLRVFAGPNGSGKSTVIEKIRNKKVNGKAIDFGFYINADDIATALRSKGFSFSPYQIKAATKDFRTIAIESGLINDKFPSEIFLKCFAIRENALHLRLTGYDEQLAQVAADYLRKKMLQERRKFSFETVFSHSSKLDIMREAKDAGYKVYLYFVSTESPLINIFRVEAREKKGGHYVPPEKIKSRYYRSLEFLYEASQLTYQAYYFDNSRDGKDFKTVAHFKVIGGKKQWDKIRKKDLTNWFAQYYLKKIP